MKNQYFGDINDYRKYGLLRGLAAGLGLPVGVCWMLTDADGSADGKWIRYLRQPERYRAHDPDLYDRLRGLLTPGVERTVTHARRWQLVPGATYFEPLLGDDVLQRDAYFEQAQDALSGCPLLFFDPDNGIEVQSVRSGHRGAAKYLYWSEIKAAYAAGHSLVIYQHFPRVERAPFVDRLVRQLRSRLLESRVAAYRTARVVFFLALRPVHAGGSGTADRLLEASWRNEIARVRPARLRAAVVS